MATIGLLQARAIRQRDILAEQLQTALNSRIVIEQAKGVIAERRVDMDQSFIMLRSTAVPATADCPTSPAPLSTDGSALTRGQR